MTLTSTCMVGDCPNVHKARGMCSQHYEEWWRAQPHDPPRPATLHERGLHHNPWFEVCPPCPHCGGRDDTYLWARDNGVNRWICAPCCAFFGDEARAIA